MEKPVELKKGCEPQAGETENDFMGRCVSDEVNNGKEQDQAVAVCMSIWGEKVKKEKEEKEAKEKAEKEATEKAEAEKKAEEEKSAKEKEWQEKFDKPLRDGKACKPKK
jgi:membrane protein involved in colicin uptake